MPYYYDPVSKNTIFVGNPDINQDLIAGKQEVSGPDYKPPDTITSDILGSQPSTNFSTYTTPGSYPLGSLSEAEKSVQSMFEQLQKLTSSTAGEAAYTQEQKNSLGISGLETTSEDLSSQLKTLLAKAQQLDVEAGLAPTKIEEQFAGQGATKGGVAPFTAAELKKIALSKSAIASEAILVSANLDATQGKIASAYKKVQDAVNVKYAPIKEEINILKDNLNLILQSPAYTEAIKAKAESQLKDKKKEEKEIAEKEEVQKSKAKSLIEIISKTNGISSVTIAELQKIAEDEKLTLLDFTKKAQELGVFVEKDELLSVAEAKTLNVPYGTTKKQAIKLGKVPGDAIEDVKLTTADKQILLGGGFPNEDITNVMKDVNTYGLPAVLANITDPVQKKALQKTFGIEEEIAIEPILNAVVTQNVATEGLKSVYTQEQLEDLAKEAGFAGFFTSKKKEVENYLQSDVAKEKYLEYLNTLIEQYKTAGIPTDQILKLLGIK